MPVSQLLTGPKPFSRFQTWYSRPTLKVAQKSSLSFNLVDLSGLNKHLHIIFSFFFRFSGETKLDYSLYVYVMNGCVNFVNFVLEM